MESRISCDGCVMQGRKKYATGVCPIMIEPFDDYSCWCNAAEYSERMLAVKKYNYENDRHIGRRSERWGLK